MPIQIAPEPSARWAEGKIDEWKLICRSPDNATAADLRNLTLHAIRRLLSGEMRAREAATLAQLCTSVYRMMPAADLEARVALLEQLV